MAEMIDDRVLYECNETELITIIQQAYGIRLRRGLPMEEYVAIAGGYCDAHEEQLSGTNETRKVLQTIIAKKRSNIRGQLPGCDGHCTTYPCSDGRHAVCYSPNEKTSP